jgi:AhpD family alkylhydroperoxidase
MRDQTLPEIAAAQEVMRQEAYKDGSLSRKIKRLVALGIALGAGCTGCILGQTKLAVDAGATKDEIYEVIGVTMSMRGTTGGAEALRVIELLDEMDTQ